MRQKIVIFVLCGALVPLSCWGAEISVTTQGSSYLPNDTVRVIDSATNNVVDQQFPAKELLASRLQSPAQLAKSGLGS